MCRYHFTLGMFVKHAIQKSGHTRLRMLPVHYRNFSNAPAVVERPVAGDSVL